MSSVDLVMPIIARDLERFRIFFASWQKFWHVSGRLILMPGPGDEELFKQFIKADSRVKVVPKRDVITDIPYAREVPGWYRQQLAKIAAAEIVESHFYLAVDADMFVVRAIEYRDLFRDGKLPWQPAEMTKERLIRYHGMADMLEEPFEKIPTGSVSWRPPFFFDTAIMKAGIGRLREVRPGMRWQEALVRSHSWGEVPFYHFSSVLGGTWESHHSLGDPVTHEFIRWPLVDVEGDFQAWDPDETFSGRYMFGVVHSFTKINPQRVADKLGSRIL